MTRRVLAALIIVIAFISVACSGDDDGGSTTTAGVEGEGQPLRIDAMGAAVAAVEAKLGGEQRYSEVNATPTLVNLFVASSDGNEISYVYDAVAGTLSEPVEQAATGAPTFTWSQADFDPAKVLGEALGQLPNSLPRLFSVTAGEGSALLYVVTLESSQGGVLDVLVDKDGKVLGAQAR